MSLWGPPSRVREGPLFWLATWMSHCRGFSYCRASAPWDGLSSLGLGFSCSMVCGVFKDQELSPCLLHWQADALPLSHEESSKWKPFRAFSVNHQFCFPEAVTICITHTHSRNWIMFSIVYKALIFVPKVFWKCILNEKQNCYNKNRRNKKLRTA